MDFNKSIFLQSQKSFKPLFTKKLTLSNFEKDNKRSEDLNGNIFFKKVKNSQNIKVNKIPLNNINSRIGIKGLNLINSSKIINNMINDNENNEKQIKKDKDYYLNYINNIYTNDSHLSKNNIIKNNIKDTKEGINKIKLEKKKTYNFSKLKNPKFSKKQISICSNDFNNLSNKKLFNFTHKSSKKISRENNDIKDEILLKKTSNLSNKIRIEKIDNKKYDDRLASKYITSENLLKVNSKKEKDIKKNLNNSINNEEEKIKYNIKEEIGYKLKHSKTMKLSSNLNKKNKNKKESKKLEKGELELEKCETKNDEGKNISKNKTLKNYSFKSCFLCCFTPKDDSFSNDI